MSNLINRLNAFGSDDPFEIAHICQEAAARIEALEAALREIASQHLYEEMEEGWRDSADWQHAYEAIVGIARAALAPEQDK